MAFGVDQLEALAECVELINTGRATAGGAAAASDQRADQLPGQRADQLRQASAPTSSPALTT